MSDREMFIALVDDAVSRATQSLREEVRAMRAEVEAWRAEREQFEAAVRLAGAFIVEKVRSAALTQENPDGE